MVKKTAKKAAPVRKKAVAKKAAPVRKKAVAKKAAPVRKKAVAKKAAPARKKAVAKKAAPARKKAVAKKAAPARTKAVAKKAVAAKKTTSTKTIVFSKNEPDEFSTTTKAPWSDAETELPAFLQSSGVEATREIVQTRAYVKKKSKSFLLWPVVGLSTVAIISFMAFSISISDTKLSDKSESVIVDERAPAEATADPVPSPSEVADSKQSPSPKPSAKIAKKAVSDTNEFAPQSFAGVATGEEISFGWKSPVSTSRIVGFELLTRPVGSQSWVAISSVTVEQMSITVELDSMLSTSEYRIASVLDNGKLIYNPLTLSFVGVVG